MNAGNTKSMLPILPILQGFGWLKTITISSIAGWMAGEGYVLALQTPPPLWYESPLMIAVVTAFSVVMVQLLVNFSDRRRQRLALEAKDDEQHSTFSTRKEELTAAERKELLNEYKELYGQELRFEKERRRVSDLQAVEARFRHHQIANALNTAQTYIFICHSLMSQKGVEFPPFVPKTEADFEEGLRNEIETYKQKLEDEIHKTG